MVIVLMVDMMIEVSSVAAVSNEVKAKETSNIPVGVNELKLKEACREFEQIFVKYLVDSMWASVEAMRGGFSGERAIWQDMLNNEMAKKVSEDSGLGIADVIYRQVSDAYMADNTAESTEAERNGSILAGDQPVKSGEIKNDPE
ncbi:MAG: rod-binding protein [Actinobacteria bacterium]|nr:rod-binding protein [Actinomycetota bacterium]